MKEKGFIGLIGLGVMGENLVLNIESKGFKVAVFNRTVEKVKRFVEGRGKGKNIIPTYSIEEFTESLSKPRKIILMVKAGSPLDEMISKLLPYLERGDILMDGGNSFYKDTERRQKELSEKGIFYIGSGISGGEKGALKGPSIMPGGERTAYDELEPVLTSISAKVNGEPCCTYIGPGGSGHFVKMVHNGIEYSDMQLIAECYDIMKRYLRLNTDEIAEIFERWNQGRLNSYLIEITGKIFKKIDPETKKPLVELILDSAGQKGTGKWTSQVALDFATPIPSIHSAVEARFISALKTQREKGASIYGEEIGEFKGDKDKFIDRLESALYLGKILSYAQGFSLLSQASKEYNWGLNLASISKIWRGGCIIRAKFLNEIAEAFSNEPEIENLLFSSKFIPKVKESIEDLRFIVSVAIKNGVPVLGFSSALSYFDNLRSSHLPHNLIQAQRDFFGAHTYRRIDKEGIFHTEWE